MQGIVQSLIKYLEREGINYDSFSLPHVKSYSMILWQELNLCHRFKNGKAYWKAACLTINSGIRETDKKGQIDYGKVAEGVGNMREDILAPDINSSGTGFTVKGSDILYGLVAINGVNEEEANKIIENRPYASFADFRERCDISNKAIISLVKAGAFDSIDSDRKRIAMEYIKDTTPLLKSLTTVQADSIVSNGLLPKELDKFVKFNSIRKDILSNKNMYKQINKTNAWYKISDNNLTMLKSLGFALEYEFNDDGDMIVQKSKLQNTFKKQTEPLNEFLKSKDALNTYNTMLLNKAWNSKFKGDYLEWQMEAIRSYLGTAHGLDKYDLSYLPISDFNKLEEGKKIDDFKYELSLVAGTVISSNKDKHTISILSKDGVIRCKLSKQMFGQYNYINSVQEGKSKTIIENSWFVAGTLVVLQGVKQGQVFYVKGYKSSSYPAITKILGKNIEGKTIYRFGRE